MKQITIKAELKALLHIGIALLGGFLTIAATNLFINSPDKIITLITGAYLTGTLNTIAFFKIKSY